MGKTHESSSERDQGPSRTVEAGQDAAGTRLDTYLARVLDLSRSRVRRLLESGRVSKDGSALRLADKGKPLTPGDRFVIEGGIDEAGERPISEPDLELDVLASGPGWVAIDKPARQAVHPLRPHETGTALNALIARRPEVFGVGEAGLRSGVVHRLDVETSGVLLFATESSDWTRIRTAFEEHRVEKRYRALVLGRFETERDVDVWLEISRHKPAKARVAEAGQGTRISQRVVPIEVWDDASLVEIHPKTGFLHQIRVTLADLGHPVIGDPRYGPFADANRAGEGPPAPHTADRHMLHACALRLDEIEAVAPDPADFVACLAGLRSGVR